MHAPRLLKPAFVTFAVAAGAALALAPLATAEGAPIVRYPGSDAAPVDGGAVSRIPPDPPPMRERMQWVFDLKYDRGDIYLLAVHKVDLGVPQETPRAMGRFALELYEGPTLIERVRFDFPFLGAGDFAVDAGFQAPPRFEPKMTTRIGVMFPATSRGTRLELWDRASDKRWPLPWPPDDAVARARDAG